MDGANTQEATAQSTVYFLDWPPSATCLSPLLVRVMTTTPTTRSWTASWRLSRSLPASMPPLVRVLLPNGLKAVIYDKSTGYITGYDNGGTVTTLLPASPPTRKPPTAPSCWAIPTSPTPMTPRCTLSTRRPAKPASAAWIRSPERCQRCHHCCGEECRCYRCQEDYP